MRLSHCGNRTMQIKLMTLKGFSMSICSLTILVKTHELKLWIIIIIILSQ